MKEKATDNIFLKNNSFLKDFGWYFAGSFIPLIIGFIKTPIFTRHFSKEEYGNLGIVSITFTYFGMFLFSWIGSCLWRYYSKYESNNKLKSLYSNLSFLYLSAIVLLLVLSLSWYITAENDLIKQLIFFSFFHLFLNQLFLFYMIVIRLKGRAKFYTIFQSIRSLISVLTALMLVFIFDKNISALISSLVIIDSLALLFLFLINPVNVKIDFRLISRNNLKELIIYGSVGLILNISLLTITYSDRYIIAWFGNLGEVGIYDQVYKISQLTVVSLVTIFFNTINPFLLKELETNFNNSIQLIRKYIMTFILFGLPVIFYLSLFSKEISNILLGEDFREGYYIMPFIFFSAYLHGFSNFFELRVKFSNKLRRLSFIAISVALINIILNIILIDLYGYQWAAFTTAISYFIMILLFYYFDKEILSFSKNNYRVFYKIIIVLALQLAFFISIIMLFNLSSLFKILIGFVFVLSYYLIFKKQLLKIEIPVN
jgi:O-antigen/teichoic acid export membrane protein